MAQNEGTEGERLPVAVVGLGDIGRAVVRRLSGMPALSLAAVVDPAHAGASLRELVEDPSVPDLRVGGEAEPAFARIEGGVAVVCTDSRLEAVAETLLSAARAGVSVVSTCEELAYPWLRDPELAERLERAFRNTETACLATGVNPGFVLDRLPATLTGVVGSVRHVLGRRVVDLANRRPALQRKAGAGLSPEAFEAAAEAGELGHVGLLESAALIAEGLDVDLEEAELEETIDAVLAEGDFDTGVVKGRAGDVSGVHQVARIFVEAREVIRLELTLSVGAEAVDELHLDADPSIHLRLEGGLAGEAATAWALVNAVPLVAGAEPGIMTVLDLPSGR